MNSTKKPVVAIVGNSGTVGLDLEKRLQNMHGIELVSLSRTQTLAERTRILKTADVAVLCLPEHAAVEFVQNAQAYPRLRILDASSAYRTHPNWMYGLPELNGHQPERIHTAMHVANPGCYATGAILLLRPIMDALVKRGISVQPDVAITAIGGVTSGGTKMIAQSEAEPFGYRLFGLNQQHRHIAEIKTFAGLLDEPTFMPAVVAHQRGTMIQIPFNATTLGLTFDESRAALQAAYAQTLNIKVHASAGGVRFLDGAELAGVDGVRIDVLGSEDKRRMVLVARFDNLGKGAAGAVEQSLRLMLDLPA